MKKDAAISVARVTATAMILLCHLTSWIPLAIVPELFSGGVELFLLLSGLLYAKKRDPARGQISSAALGTADDPRASVCRRYRLAVDPVGHIHPAV